MICLVSFYKKKKSLVIYSNITQFKGFHLKSKIKINEDLGSISAIISMFCRFHLRTDYIHVLCTTPGH